MIANLIPDADRTRYRAAGLWRDTVLTQALDRWAAAHPDKPAIVECRKDGGISRLSYAELRARTDSIAAALAAEGVGEGDVVSLQLPNWWQFTALYLALVRLRAIINPIMPIFRAHEVGRILADTASRVLVIPGTFRRFDHQAMIAELMPRLPALERVFVADAEPSQPFRSFDHLWARRERAALQTPPPDPDGVTELLFTSGTTGRPKGVLHSHNTLLAPVFACADRLGLNQDDVIFMASPFAHQTGFDYGMVQGVLLGCTTVYLDQWDPALAWGLMADFQVTFTMGATPFLADTVREAARREAALPALRYFIAAGAPIPRAIVEEAGRRMPSLRVLAGWGMTENGLVTINGPEDPASKVYTTDGSPQPGMEVAIFDEAGAALPPGREGYLKVRGSQNFVGYLGDEAGYRGSFDADGWFQTWDLAARDAEGYIRITGRAKDVINRGGEKVPVAEVEELIYRHPKVREAALVAMAHARLGETGCLFAATHEGQPLTLAEIVAHLRGAGLTPQFLPERLELVNALPRTPSGKIQKYLLREEIARRTAT